MQKITLGETIRALRRQKKLSQRELADMLYVDRSTVANWESNRRIPDTSLISNISSVLGVEKAYLIDIASGGAEEMTIIMVDDEKISLVGSLPIIEEFFPDASIQCFTRPSEALRFAQTNPVHLAFLDIEIGRTSGLELCKKLQDINPDTTVLFLTAYMDYSFKAWETGASGYILKPLTRENVKKQLRKLHFLFPDGGEKSC